jgi:hypothetical protein
MKFCNGRLQLIASAFLGFCALLHAQSGTVTTTTKGWTITADPSRSTLTISHDVLGSVLEDVRLGIRNSEEINELSGWTVRVDKDERLLIETRNPQTMWIITPGQDSLLISSTQPNAVLQAEAPAPASRIVARLIDTQGTPVVWEGTGENVQTYGGTRVTYSSFLPRENPDVMYLSLGQVSGSQFHSLFDRKTDTAIDFQSGTLLDRANADTLRVTIMVDGNTQIRLTPDYFTKTLHVPFYSDFDDSRFKTAPMVWSSWTSYYQDVTEQDIIRNADWLAAHLEPYGFEYVQLDDGYDRHPEGHYWIENWDQKKFPHGPKWLADYIKSKGLKAGIWLVPNAYAGAVKDHPDWYLYDKQGKILLDYGTPALDSTNPQVLNFLKHEFSILDGWGFEYYKFDGESALGKYAPSLDRGRLYNISVDPIANYRDRLRTIRDSVGQDSFIEGCPTGAPLDGIGFFTSYFNGDDLYNNWQGMYSMFSSINANEFLNHLVVYVMPGEGLALEHPMTVEEAKSRRPPIVIETEKDREFPLTGFGTTDSEARSLVSYVSLTGVAYSLASVMPELPQDRVDLLQKTMPTMPIMPMDLFSRGTQSSWDKFKFVHPDNYIHNYPEILDLKVNQPAGKYDVIAMTNWRSEPLARHLSLVDKLGLSASQEYVVFDFWNQKILGLAKRDMNVPIAPHDTRVLLIHPLLNRPQFVGNSRHITGAYSILSQSWNADSHILSGSSITVDGHSYTLYFYLPGGARTIKAEATDQDGHPVKIQQQQSGNSLAITFRGQKTPVTWKLYFQ